MQCVVIRREHLSRAVVSIRSGLAGPVVVVGVLGGVVGAAYVGLLKVLGNVMGPDGHGPLLQLAILTAVGVAVALITRFAGETGDVEFMVDNIHVLGGAEDVRRLRP